VAGSAGLALGLSTGKSGIGAPGGAPRIGARVIGSCLPCERPKGAAGNVSSVWSKAKVGAREPAIMVRGSNGAVAQRAQLLGAFPMASGFRSASLKLPMYPLRGQPWLKRDSCRHRLP
jgi:hypothetical protein